MFFKTGPIITAAMLSCNFLFAGNCDLLKPESVFADDDGTEKSFMYGDINMDGEADLTDLTLLSLFLMDAVKLDDVQKKAADVDGNDENDIRDLAHMKRYVCKDNVVLGPQKNSKEKVTETLTQLSSYEELYDYVVSNPENMVFDTTLYPEYTVDYNKDNYMGYSSSEFSKEYNNDVVRFSQTITDGNVKYSFEDINAYHIDGYALLAEDINGSFTEEKNFTAIVYNDFPSGKPVTVLPMGLYMSEDHIFTFGIIQLINSRYYSYVSVYEKGGTGEKPVLADTYFQEGKCVDHFVTPDGYLYLVTNAAFTEGSFGFNESYSRRFGLSRDPDYFADQPAYGYFGAKRPEYSEEYAKTLIPEAGRNYDLKNIPSENVYLRSGKENGFANACTVISSINIKNTEKVDVKDIKVVSGYTGRVYASEENIYLSNTNYSIDDKVSPGDEKICIDRTDITRLSVSEGEITPQASGSVRGIMHKMPSMKEINGKLVVLTTSVYYKIPDERDEYVLTDFSERAGVKNSLFVLDEELKPEAKQFIFSESGIMTSVSFEDTNVVVKASNKKIYDIDISDLTAPAVSVSENEEQIVLK